MRLALYGGTFDPVHSAHLTVAREARDRFRLDRVLLVPNANPPHKAGGQTAPYADRLRMVELACAGEPGLEASDLEAGTARSYSILTIERVRTGLAPDDELFFLIGADAFAEIETWHRWPEVVALVEFIVVSRPGHSAPHPAGSRVRMLSTLALPVSSSDIRRQLAAGEEPAELPAPVLGYIRRMRLYGAVTPT